MHVRQSDLKTWQKCPLQYRWQHIENLPRLQGGSSIFGSVIHDCVLYLETTQDLEGAVDRFKVNWRTPELLDPTYRVDYYERGRNWGKFLAKGEDILRRWWNIISWETDLVLAREYRFSVPIGNGHVLDGTVDKITVRWHAATAQWILLISDYKTNAKVPTYNYLEEDLQFTAYSYASLQREFWEPMFPGDPAKGLALWERYKDLERHGEWVALQDSRRMDAGIRTERHYNRLTMAVNALADSVAMRIFVPTISGESCRYCDFRHMCGLPELMEDS